MRRNVLMMCVLVRVWEILLGEGVRGMDREGML